MYTNLPVITDSAILAAADNIADSRINTRYFDLRSVQIQLANDLEEKGLLNLKTRFPDYEAIIPAKKVSSVLLNSKKYGMLTNIKRRKDKYYRFSAELGGDSNVS